MTFIASTPQIDDKMAKYPGSDCADNVFQQSFHVETMMDLLHRATRGNRTISDLSMPYQRLQKPNMIE